MKSIKSTISSFLIFSIIIVSILVGVLSMLNFYDMKINSVEHSLKQVLMQVSSEVKKQIKNIENLALYISSNKSNEDELLKILVETNSEISSILILNYKGYLKNFYTKNNDNIYKGFDYSNKEFFKNVKDKSYWSNIYLSSINNLPVVSYSYKTKQNDIIVIMLELEKLSEFITKFKNSDNTHMIRMLDKNGVFIINSDKPTVVTQRFNIKSSSVFKQLIENKPQYTITQFDGVVKKQKNIGMYSIIEETGWILIIRESYELFLDTLEKILISIFFLVILFIFFALYFIFKIFNKLFDEIDYLQDTTKSISNGEYNQNIKKSEYKEFFSLIKSFEKMKKEIINREKNLKKSRDSFEFLLNSTMEAIIIHNTKVCLDVNEVTLKLLGAKNKEQLIGKDIFEIISPNFLNLAKTNILINTDPYELEIMKLNGEQITTLAQGKFIELNGEKVKISSFIDITELKNKDKLLSQQSKMVSMGEMIGNIAHQWRQPLSSISTAASGIKIEKEFGLLDDETLNTALDMIIKNTKYLSKTIDDFRNFYKVDKEVEDIKIKEVVDKAIKLLDSSFKNHFIKVQAEYEEELFIKGYSNELTQAFINIINNAKDALKTKEEENRFIFIKTYSKKDNVIICIKDNAGGIPKDILPKIFDPYFTTKHQSQGTGIGLYMTHQIIVDHMKGVIEVENVTFEYMGNSYNGCEFKIYFSSL